MACRLQRPATRRNPAAIPTPAAAAAAGTAAAAASTAVAAIPWSAAARIVKTRGFDEFATWNPPYGGRSKEQQDLYDQWKVISLSLS